METVGGLLAQALGRVPIAGSAATVAGLRLTAENLAGRRNRIGTVLVERLGPASGRADGSAPADQEDFPERAGADKPAAAPPPGEETGTREAAARPQEQSRFRTPLAAPRLCQRPPRVPPAPRPARPASRPPRVPSAPRPVRPAARPGSRRRAGFEPFTGEQETAHQAPDRS